MHLIGNKSCSDVDRQQFLEHQFESIWHIYFGKVCFIITELAQMYPSRCIISRNQAAKFTDMHAEIISARQKPLFEERAVPTTI
jgi:hypothetical protein